MLKTLLFKIAKSPVMGRMVGIAFQHFSWAIPVKKVYQNRNVIAFYHPKPSYENHLIISPKRAIKNLQKMASDNFIEYFVKIWEAVKDICEMYPEYHDSFVLVANGGKRQEVGQVHFHMFTGHEILNFDWEVHEMIIPVYASQRTKEDFENIMQSITMLDEKYGIVQKGYSLVYQYEKQKSDIKHPVFHIIAGKKQEKENTSNEQFIYHWATGEACRNIHKNITGLRKKGTAYTGAQCRKQLPRVRRRSSTDSGENSVNEVAGLFSGPDCGVSGIVRKREQRENAVGAETFA